MEITLELGDLLKRIFVRDPKKRITIQQIRDHPWVNIDFPDKILLVPALPPLDDAEDIGKAIGSVHNENEFTVYILKAHATSKKNSPNSSDSNVKLSKHHTSNGSSLKMEQNRSINFLEQSSSSNEIVMRGGRRASSHDNVKDSRHSQPKPTEPIPASQNALPRKSSKTYQNDLSLLLPSSFSNELSRKQSISSQLSQEHRKHSTTLSESSSNYISESARDWGRRGSASVSISPSRTSSLGIRTSTKMLEDEDILDVSEAADLAVKNISLTSRRMSIGPEKRAPAPVMIKEESFSGENLDGASDEEESVAGSNHAHEEFSLKEYSYARRPSYRRPSITMDPTTPTSPTSALPRDMNTIIPNPSPIPTTLLRRASFNAARRDSASSRNNFPPAPKEIDIPSVITTVPRVGSGSLTDDNEKEPPTRKRATTVTGTPGTKSSQSSSKFVVEERRDIWEDDSVKMASSISTTSKLSNESSSLSTGDKTDKNANTIVTMEMINNWHQIHKPAKTVRTMRYSFNKSTTSSLYEPARIFQDVHKVLLDIADAGQDLFLLAFQRPTNFYLFECSIIYPNREESLKFDIEVCKVWLLKMHGIRIKRLQGDSFDYKQIHNDIVERLGYNG